MTPSTSIGSTPSPRKPFPLYAAILVLAGLLLLGFNSTSIEAHNSLTPAPLTPTIDRLATPVMPEHPTQFDLGRAVYYLNCMPCHGDRGQGLTDEWRAVWVEDHQNCWARGCHGGRVEDEGFPLPHSIPAVVGASTMAATSSQQALLDYLQTTHPPQRPGALSENDYRDVTVYLLTENGRPAETTQSTTNTSDSTSIGLLFIPIGLAISIGLAVIIRRQRRNSRMD
jgi:hypothetical protein